MSYDETLYHAGEYGHYQKRINVLLCVISIVGVYHIVGSVFNAYEPEFRCAVPGLVNDTYEIQDQAHAALVNLAIPYDANKGKYSECTVYRVTSLSNTSLGAESNTTQPCERWVYSKEVFTSTIATQLDLVCDRGLFKAHANMLALFGMLVFCLLGGTFSDIFGRKRFIVGALVFNAGLSIATTFLNSVIFYMIVRFLGAGTIVSSYITIIAYCTEIVGPNKRGIASSPYIVGWGVGMILAAADFYFFRSWTTAHLIFVVPTTLLIGLCYFIPESPRWLISKGRHQEAREIILKMASANHKVVPQHLLRWDDSAFTSSQSRDGTPQIPLWHIMKSWTFLRIGLIMCFNFVACTTVYYGLVLNAGSLIRFNIFLNVVVMAIMDMSSTILMLWMTEHLGRKLVFCVCMLIGGGACLATMGPILAGSKKAWINMLLSNSGRFFVTGAFSMVFVWASEMLPTRLRNSGVGMYASIGRVGGMISPYIANISYFIEGDVGVALSLGVFGIVPIISGLLSFALPETRNRKMPDTTQDLKYFYMSGKAARKAKDIIVMQSGEEQIPMVPTNHIPHI